MQKPITIIRKELIEKIVGAINGAGLPLFAVESILQNLLESVRASMRVQEEKDAAEYAEYLRKMTAQTSENNAKPSKAEG